MRVWNKPCDSAEDGKRFNLEVSCCGNDRVLVQRDVRIVFLVDVEIFNEAFMKEVVESKLPLLQLLQLMLLSELHMTRRKMRTHGYMCLRHFGSLVLNNDHRTTDASAIAGDMNSPVVIVYVNADEFADSASSP